MSRPRFLEALREGERVPVPTWSRDEHDDDRRTEMSAVRTVLEGFDSDQRQEMAGEAPIYSPSAARWGAEILYRSCCASVSPEIPIDEIRETLERPFPETPTASVDYSVDLTLRFLPDLYRRLRRRSRRDPLLESLWTILAAWPLSSVGARPLEGDGVAPVRDVSSFIHDFSLRQLYVDRILAEGDISRLDEPTVRSAVRESVGGHGERFPRLREALDV